MQDTGLHTHPSHLKIANIPISLKVTELKPVAEFFDKA